MRRRRPAPAADPPGPSEASFERELKPGALGSDQRPVTRMLHDRLGPDVVEAIRRQMNQAPEIRRMEFEKADEDTRRLVELSLGMWFEIAGVAERTGLPGAKPLDEFH